MGFETEEQKFLEKRKGQMIKRYSGQNRGRKPPELVYKTSISSFTSAMLANNKVGSLSGCKGHYFFKFNIERRGKKIPNPWAGLG